MQLAFGLSRAVPEDVTTAWGARLIAPDDLLHNRQSLVAENDEAKQELIAWLNGTANGNGAIKQALARLRAEHYPDGEEFVVYEDADGIVVGNTNRSGGYVYVAGWLKPDRLSQEDRRGLRETRRSTEIGRAHDALTVDHYEVTRMPITTERWSTHYGWSKAEVAKMTPSPNSTEVRIFAVYADGEMREIEGEPAGSFEFGYGGSGPHETARAIVNDLGGCQDQLAPASLRELVPEVFEADDDRSSGRTVVVSAAAVTGRRAASTTKTLTNEEIAVIIDSLAATRETLRKQGVATPTIDSALATINSLVTPSSGAMVLSVA